MNNWNFNELTQGDLYDFKACQRQDKSIYGVPDKSDCQKGKEIKLEDLEKLEKAAKSGDKNASAQLKKINDVQREQEKKAKEAGEAKKAADKKKKAEGGGKGKKGKGGKGKKGGGKGKGGKGGKGGGAGTPQPKAQVRQASRKEQQQAMRKRLGELQKSLRSIKNPETRKLLENQISELIKGVAELSKNADAGKTPEGGAPAQPAPPKKES